jgi:tetratricopeptide (TPR) repeat protein
LQQAAPLLAEATRLAEAKLTDREEITTEAQLAYGQVLGLMGDWKGAERHFDAAERGSRRSGDMARLSAALRGKASVLADEVQYDRAIELGWEAVRAAESQPPPIDKRAVIACYLSVAAKLHIAQRKGAIAPAQRAYALARDLYGNRPTAQLLEAQMRYANALGLEGDTTNALQPMKEVLQRQADVFGADHPEVARGLMSLGQLSLKLGDPVSAIESMGESVRIWVLHSDGKPTTELAGSRINFGAALANAHRYDKALVEWREANSLYCALYGADNEAARVARSGMALALTKLGRLEEADALYAALLATPFSSATEEAFINGRLGLLRSAQGRHDEALALLQGAPDFFADAPKGRLRGLTLADSGAALVAGRRYAEALEQLGEARAILLESQHNGSPDLADIALDISRAQLALGHADEAVKATEEATAFWTGWTPPTEAPELRCCGTHAR